MATTTYTRIATNVAKEGNSYRVRYNVKGVRKSKSFQTKKAALEFKRSLG